MKKIILNHVLEHFLKPIELIEELHRICKKGAIINIRVPYFSHESAYSNMTHYHQFTWTSFDFLEGEHSQHWQGTGKFEIISKKLIWRKIFYLFQLIFNEFPRVYQELFCWILPAKELRIKLKVIK
ncbi:MAG: hypothetical protein IIA85_00015 [Nanoarchaeota archaeon]|nr:hypothetical protein [Nanoarchaeota archaeon]